MLMIKPSKIYISSANVDMRKSIDGLASIVEQKFVLSSMYPPNVPTLKTARPDDKIE